MKTLGSASNVANTLGLQKFNQLVNELIPAASDFQLLGHPPTTPFHQREYELGEETGILKKQVSH